MVCPNLLLSIQNNIAGYLGLPFIHSSNIENKEEQGLYFHVVLLTKARSCIFQCNIIEKVISQRFRK